MDVPRTTVTPADQQSSCQSADSSRLTCRTGSSIRLDRAEPGFARRRVGREIVRFLADGALSCIDRPMIGTVVSRYRILSKLGMGRVGVVYEAEDTELGRHVALKFPPPETAQSHEALARFKREAQAAGSWRSTRGGTSCAATRASASSRSRRDRSGAGDLSSRLQRRSIRACRATPPSEAHAVRLRGARHAPRTARSARPLSRASCGRSARRRLSRPSSDERPSVPISRASLP